MAGLYGLIQISSPTTGQIVQVEPEPFPVYAPALAWVQIDGITPQPAVGWIAALSGTTWSFSAPVVASPTLSQQAAALIAGGLNVASKSSPAINATYPCDINTISKIYGVQLGIASGVGLPGGAEAIPWKDANGAWHSLTAAQFTGLAAAVSAFVTMCQLCIDGFPGAALPEATATIA